MLTRHLARRVAHLLATSGSPRHADADGTPGTAARAAPRATPLSAALCAATLAGLLTACTMPTHPDSAAVAPDPFNPAAAQLLDNTSWNLSSWKQQDGSMRPVAPADSGAPITLVLSTSSGQRRASGFSGCNRYTGTYALQDGKLSFGPLAGTRMACATPGGQIEGPYLDALAHIDRTGVQMRPPEELQLILEDGDTLTFTSSTP